MDVIKGIEATCIDAATPLVMLRAGDLDKSGHETPAELDGDRPFMARLNATALKPVRAWGWGT